MALGILSCHPARIVAGAALLFSTRSTGAWSRSSRSAACESPRLSDAVSHAVLRLQLCCGVSEVSRRASIFHEGLWRNHRCCRIGFHPARRLGRGSAAEDLLRILL